MEDNSKQIEELKELVRRSIALSEDTNHMVHSIRRSARWSFILTALWWVGVASISGAAYYYFIAPYIHDIMSLYSSAQEALHKAQALIPGR